MKNAKIYETHVHTKNLETAINFYESLGLRIAFIIEDRRVAFFYLGEEGSREQMLGVWEVRKEEFTKSHFAFSATYEELLNIPNYLKEKGITLRPSFGLKPTEPIVHSWMPAASYYFYDPDGNSLEYITLLEGEPIPQLGPVHLSTWLKHNENPQS
ncbi:VOC family protein [Bacillus salitolerans]|uniref:VOC family protein n=1 Tax=Bacillus salitolerans TaxID=1437434 RepID=A0ABW4LS65_9BACI